MLTALVTGGTSGIGAAFAEALARRGHALVLVARDADRLEQTAARLRAAHGVPVEVLSADLVDRADVDRVAARIEDPARPVDVVVNNAGFSVKTPFSAEDTSAHDRAFEVMCRAVLVLSSAAARAMTARGSGWIINVSSVAGLITMGSYSALKTYTTAFTEALAVELAGTGVHVTALLPGWVRTEFHERAGITGSSIPSFMWLTPERVVEEALDDVARGKVISMPTRRYRLLALFLRHAPRSTVRRISGLVASARQKERAAGS
ncbi:MULTISPECIES: SDR family NAD(P)-dependent oxidoreductase [Kocuria]|jgi:short-subunit dehydrogenase|uniref:SDR family NAD(P)-dependent oxidoreductase n=1 Tax=Kocuria TaxID=57493 RepID=UPI00204147C0|nr:MULTISPECIES: SDR family oxidoreductase [Kocuria]MCM3689577.1 SDR family oxidoreductase [Kocuria rosea]HST71399.1 SDR family oxidoreductase [Kocuria rosea]